MVRLGKAGLGKDFFKQSPKAWHGGAWSDVAGQGKAWLGKVFNYGVFQCLILVLME